MFYVLHGDDEFRRSETLVQLKRRMGDPAIGDLNTTTLDGRKLTLSELIHACDAIPFLSERRLVIVEDLLTRLEARRGRRKGDQKEKIPAATKDLARGLEKYVRRLPDTTRLVFVESHSLSQKNPILKLAQTGEAGYVKEFPLPRRGELDRWIKDRVKEKGGEIRPDAVMQLAAFVGPDLRLLDQEIEKLLTYLGSARPISRDDVQLLVSSAREASIFDLVDALGLRNRTQAVNTLHRLLDDGQSPIYVLFMIARQFRILLQVKELRTKGATPVQIQKTLGLHKFVVKKAIQQMGNFRASQLEAVHQRLLEADISIKTGQAEAELALDLLIAELTA